VNLIGRFQGASVGREEALADAEVPKAGGDKWRQGFVNSEACWDATCRGWACLRRGAYWGQARAWEWMRRWLYARQC